MYRIEIRWVIVYVGWVVLGGSRSYWLELGCSLVVFGWFGIVCG